MKDLTDAELDELGELLSAAPEPLQSLDVPMLDGYLVGVLVQPRHIEPDEWLPPVFDLERRPLPADVDAAWLARSRELIERRFDALNEQIAEFGRFDPVVANIDDLPPVSEYDAVQSPVSRALMPWVVGFDWALQCFPDLEDSADEAAAALLDRLWRHLPPEEDEAKALVQRLDAERPLRDIEAALDDLVLVCVDLWDRTVDRRYSVATRRRTTPKVGRNDPCPCGSGRKFKACHGRT